MWNFRIYILLLSVLSSNCGSGRAQVPLHFIKCDDTSWILNYVRSAPADQIIAAIITPLDDSSFPSFFNNLKDAILMGIQTGSLPVDRVIDNLPNMSHLNHYDLMISTLLAIKVNTPVPCPIKEAIDKAVEHLLTRKYFNDDGPPDAFDFNENCQSSYQDDSQELAPISSSLPSSANNYDLRALLNNPKLALDQATINDLASESENPNSACGCQSKLIPFMLGKLIEVLPDRHPGSTDKSNQPDDLDLYGHPSSTTPYQSTPYQSTPYQSNPYQSTSYQSNPHRSTPYQSTSYQSNPDQSTPYQSTPYQSTPYQSTPYQSTPYQTHPYESPSNQSPSYENPSNQSPSYENPSSQSPSYEIPSNQSPSYENPSNQNPSYEIPSNQSPSYENPSNQSPSYEIPSNQSPSYENPSNQNPSYEIPSNQSPSYENPSNQSPSYDSPPYDSSPSPIPDIMQWLQTPENPDKLRLFNLISDYFRSPEGQHLLQSLNLPELMKIYSPEQILEIVFNSLIQQSPNAGVVDAVKKLYYGPNGTTENSYDHATYTPPAQSNDMGAYTEAPFSVQPETAIPTTPEVRRPRYDYATLVPLIPHPVTEEDRGHYTTLKGVLEDPETRGLLTDLQPEEGDEPERVFDGVLDHLEANPVSPPDVVAAAKHYKGLGQEDDSRNFNYPDLMKALPQPKTDADREKYAKLAKLLGSSEIHKILKDIDPSKYPNIDDLLEVVLETIIKKTTLTDIKDTVQYIIDYQLEERLNDKYRKLLDSLPPASSDEDTRMHQNLEEYFDSDEINEIFHSFKPTNDTDNATTLEELLKLISTNAKDNKAKEAASYFLNRIALDRFIPVMERLLKYLPTPTPEETPKYELMKNFLTSGSAYEILKDFDLSLFDNDKFLLETILKKFAESANVPEDVVTACKYYVAAVEKLESLDFVTKKEISKSFKLTEMFADTIELDKLNIDQRVAFKRLFKFISGIQPGSLDGFDSWDQAKTQGEFIKLFFKYLLESYSVPKAIKNAISTLDPLVRLDGKGALPP